MELLTNEQMQNADRLTIESGVPSFELMQSAAKAVAEHIGSKFETDCSVLIVCGPGNNGGDGYVIGKLLLEKGFPVSVWSPFPLDRLQGDAAKALEYWGDEVSVGAPPTEITDDVVVDAKPLRQRQRMSFLSTCRRASMGTRAHSTDRRSTLIRP